MPLTDDAKARLRHVRLSVWEVKMVQFCAATQGEMRFDFRNVKEAVRKAMIDLVTKQMFSLSLYEDPFAVVDPQSLVRTPRVVKVRLTDQARAVLDAMGQMTVS